MQKDLTTSHLHLQSDNLASKLTVSFFLYVGPKTGTFHKTEFKMDYSILHSPQAHYIIGAVLRWATQPEYISVLFELHMWKQAMLFANDYTDGKSILE